MTEHAKPAEPEHPKSHEPKAAARARPEKPAWDRKKAAMKVVKEYRNDFPEDPRDDDTLLKSPYGGYEVADLDARHEIARAERLNRLAASNPDNPEKPA